MDEENELEPFLIIAEACKILRTSETTVRRWIREGRVPCYRFGNEYKFFKSELKEFILKNKVN